MDLGDYHLIIFAVVEILEGGYCSRGVEVVWMLELVHLHKQSPEAGVFSW